VAALLVFSFQGAQSQLDVVVKRASRYVDTYMKQLGSITGEERYFQTAAWEDRDTRNRKITTSRTRQLVSDILTVPIGEEWIGIRHVRQIDDVTLDPMYRGFWRERFDESTPKGRADLLKAFTFESTRYNIGDIARATNLPTFPLELLSEDNLAVLSLSKIGEERIGNAQTWKVRFTDRERHAFMMDAGIGPDERFSIAGILWIEPTTGRVFRAEVDFINRVRENIEIHMEVRFRPDPTVGLLVPATMIEHYEDRASNHEIDAHAEYTNFRKFDSTVRLDSVWREAPPAGPDLTQKEEDRYAMKVDVRVVNVEAWVTVGGGSAVTDLNRDDFSVSENNIPQNITNFSPVSTPYDVLLLFDRSGSTQRDWSLMQRAAEGFVASLRPQDRVGIANFDTSLRVLTRWTDTRQQIARVLSGFTEGKRPGGTFFYRAVEASLAAELPPVAGRRRALVVLTDGRDNSLFNLLMRRGNLLLPREEPQFMQMIELARRERVPIYVVGISNSSNEVSRLAMAYSGMVAESYVNAVGTRLEQLAESSGGRVLFTKRLDEIVPLYTQISRELGSAYSIGYVSSLPVSEQGFREIKVTTSDRRLRVVQSRSGYVVQ